MPTEQLVVFNDKHIRRTLYNNEWWYVVADIISALTDTMNSTDYIKKMRRRDKQLSEIWENLVVSLRITTQGGSQKIMCANTESIFRIIQSIPSTKAEPFKRWLAKVGYERIQEIENPEIASARTREIYKAKGYSDAWIEKRMRGIAVRDELTEEWRKRGIQKPQDFSILTAEISKATFGMTPTEYKKFKNLKQENLRDHMSDLELIFSMLGEASTTEIARHRDTQGFQENQQAAQEGGKIAGDARKGLEEKTGQKVISRTNYLESLEPAEDEK